MNELDKKRNRLQHIITRRRPTLYCLESVAKTPYSFAPPLERVGRRGQPFRSPWCGRRLLPCLDRESSVQPARIKSRLWVGKCHSPFWNIPNRPFIYRPFTSRTLAQALYRRHSPNYGALPVAVCRPRCTLNGAASSRCLGLLPPRLGPSPSL